MKEPVRAERETIIRWSEDERIAYIYTGSQTVRRKLDKRCKDCPDTYSYVGEDTSGWGWRYTVNAKYIRFGKPSAAKSAMMKERQNTPQ